MFFECMDFPGILCLIGAHSSFPVSGGNSALIGATVSLSSGYHPQSNGQTQRLNQELETCLRCLVSQNPASWSRRLMWVEFAHNSLPRQLDSLRSRVPMVISPPVSGGGEGGRGTVGSCTDPPMSPGLGSSSEGPHSQPGQDEEDGRSTAGSGPGVQGRSKRLVIHQGFTPSCDLQEAGSQVCGPLYHLQSG